MISKKFITPRTPSIWQQFVHYARDLDWSLIWKNGFTNNLLDPDDTNFMFKLKHMIHPTLEMLYTKLA